MRQPRGKLHFLALVGLVRNEPACGLAGQLRMTKDFSKVTCESCRYCASQQGIESQWDEVEITSPWADKEA